MPPVRRVFTEEFKRDAVRLAKERGNTRATERGNTRATERDLGVSETVLSRWKTALCATPANPFPGQSNPTAPERARLEREKARLREENAILWVSSPATAGEIPLPPGAARHVFSGRLVPRHAGVGEWLSGMEQTRARCA